MLQLSYDLPYIHAVDFRAQVVDFTYILFKIILWTLTKFNAPKILGFWLFNLSSLTLYLLKFYKDAFNIFIQTNNKKD